MKLSKRLANRCLTCLLAALVLAALVPPVSAFAELPSGSGVVSFADGNIARAPDVSIAASYSNTTNGAESTQVARINNGSLPSGTDPTQGWNSWNTNSFPVTVTLTWAQPYLADALRVMWWYDGTGSGAGVSLPGNCAVQYNAGSIANPVWTNVSNMKNAAGDSVTTVANQGSGTTGTNRTWNGVSFDPLVTQQLRLSISKGLGTGVGIGEWEVFGQVAPTELYSVNIQGDAAMYTGEEHTYTANVIPPTLTDVGYEWTLDNANATIVGPSDAGTVTVKGVAGGSAKLSLKVTHTSGVQEATADFNIAITTTELVSASISGNSRLLEDKELAYTSTIQTPGLTGVGYKWTLDNGNAAIVGSDDAATVTLRGVSEGDTVLSLKATHNSGVQEAVASYNIKVIALKAKTYDTATSAGKAPILPKRVVLENLLFDTPTANTAGSYNFGESFNDSLVEVDHWDAVPASDYALDKVGTTFTVAGVVKYGGKDYPATASVKVNEPLPAPDYNNSVTSENVVFNDVFWKPKQLVNATSSFDAAFVQLSAVSGSWTEERNFVNAKARLDAVHQGNENPPMGLYTGYVFADTDIYKTLEGVSYNLAAIWDDPSMGARKEVLQNKLNYWIGLIESIQYADGYINSAFSNRTSVSSGGSGSGNWRWRYMDRHEMYNIGHFLESAVAYTRYREGVGMPDYRLYEVGKRAADHVVSKFGPNGSRVEVPGHEEVELGLMKMATLVEEYEGQNAGDKYRLTAKQLVDRRGNRTGANARQSGYNGGTYSQDATPIINETKAVGHAVRAMYFYTGVTDVATWLNKSDTESASSYLRVMDRIWENASERNTYITGGIGSSQPGSSSEGFGSDYALSNTQSYCEICAAIAMSNWNQRLNLVHEDAKYADSYEKSLYNGALVGVNLAGGRFYYSTPIERTNTGSSRHLWESVACCEPNILRTIANMGGYLYTVKNNDVFVNMYAGSTAGVNVDGTNVSFEQVTNYPWDGAVAMTVVPAASKEFTVNIRIPGWVKAQKNQEVKISVDGTVIDSTPSEKGYVAITRNWSASGTLVNIDIPMEARITEPDNNVHNIGTATHSNRNRIAIERGPIVYCLEDAGTGTSTSNTFAANQVVFPRSMELTPVWRPDLLRGVVALTGTALYNGEEREVTLTPYYAWNNRGTDPANLGNGDTNGSGRMVIWANATGSTVQIRGEKSTLATNAEASLMAVPHVNFDAAASDMPTSYKWSIVSGPAKIVGDPTYEQAPVSGYEKLGGVLGANATNTVAYYASTARVKATGKGVISVKVEALKGTDVLYSDTYTINKDVADEPATGVSLDNEALTITTGKTAALTATVAPEDAANKNVMWESSDLSVATVDADGTVTANSAGTATITATTVDGGFTATCTVTVADPVGSDKVLLKEFIDIAEEELASDNNYIPAAMANLEAALEDAKAVFDNDRATQEEVDEALDGLLNAIWQLYDKGDKTDLQALIDMMEQLPEDDYTPNSWADFQDALELAKAVADNENAIQDKVDKAIADLMDAFDELVRVADFRSLSSAVTLANRIIANFDDYIASTVLGLEDHVALAQAVLSDRNSTQAEVDAARNALNKLIAKARLKPDKSPILNALAEARSLNMNLYTSASAKSLGALIAKADALLAAPEEKVTQSEINALATEIKGAIKDLEPKQGAQAPAASGGKASVSGGTATVSDKLDKAEAEKAKPATAASGTQAAPSTGAASQPKAAASQPAATAPNGAAAIAGIPAQAVADAGGDIVASGEIGGADIAVIDAGAEVPAAGGSEKNNDTAYWMIIALFAAAACLLLVYRFGIRGRRKGKEQ